MRKKFSTVILYHAYGLTEIYQQVLFSLLTLYYHLEGEFHEIGIVVYTDKPRLFERYATAMPLFIQPLDQETIEDFKGKDKFVHRVKIKIIQACFSMFHSDILYLDSDTYFTGSPIELLNKISPGISVMNSNDYDLISADELFENNDWLDIRRAIRDYSYTIENQKIKIPLTTRMWNAGVIGICLQDSKLLDQVLNLTDQIYANKAVFTAEQFAFSYFLQKKTHLIASGDVIFHYWPNFTGRDWKQTYNYHFNLFFKQNGQAHLKDQALLAYQLSQQHEWLVIPKRTLLGRIWNRLKLVIQVALIGKN